MIYDADGEVYQVSSSVLPRPGSNGNQYANHNVHFDFQPEPFSFRILRDVNGEEEVLFDTTDTGLTLKDVSKQYAEIVGLPAMQSYWTFGVCTTRPHCRVKITVRVPQLPLRTPGYLCCRRSGLHLQ